MTIKPWLGLLLATLAAPVLTPDAAHAELRVVTTTTDLGDLVRTVGGDRVHVDTVCSGTQDPHYVQARPSYMVTLSRADLVVSVGLELEVGWLPALVSGARNPDINPGHTGYFEAGSAIKPIDVPVGPVDRASGDIHPLGNPHFWLDPENAKLVAQAIADRMAALDATNAAFYQDNARAFSESIDRAMLRWRKAMAPYQGAKVVSYHRTFNYFFNRFGLVGAGYIEERPGIPPAPAHLVRLIAKMRADKVPVIFHENYYDRTASDLVGKRANAQVLVLPTSVGGTLAASSYEKLIDTLVDAFVAAYGQPHE